MVMQRRIKEKVSPLPWCPVNCECSWKKLQQCQLVNFIKNKTRLLRNLFTGFIGRYIPFTIENYFPSNFEIFESYYLPKHRYVGGRWLQKTDRHKKQFFCNNSIEHVDQMIVLKGNLESGWTWGGRESDYITSHLKW